jgi:hypothetical protein
VLDRLRQARRVTKARQQLGEALVSLELAFDEHPVEVEN